MGLLDGSTQRQYYEANTFGGYQFTSLDDIINQFEVAYVGENKIIPKIKRADIQFHAMRALQELSFDTFKSIKSQQIELPPSMVMPLPHDYVNYTKISWPDSSGIKHPLYPTKHTSNPFQIDQFDGAYQFDDGYYELLVNTGFVDPLLGTWNQSVPTYIDVNDSTYVDPATGGPPLQGFLSEIDQTAGTLSFKHRNVQTTVGGNQVSNVIWMYQTVDVTNRDFIDLSAVGEDVGFTTEDQVLRVGVSSVGLPTFDVYYKELNPGFMGGLNTQLGFFDLVDENGSPSYLEWKLGDGAATKSLNGIDVSSVDSVDIIIISYHEPTTYADATSIVHTQNKLESVSAFTGNIGDQGLVYQASLTSPTGNEKNSSTWNSYKSSTPSQNQDDYMDDTYWPMDGSRFGLDPQHAQANGSFYIDDRLGRIHFSSNISGKTVILDYISDSLGTDAEMQVHKFAEDAMYKCIAHAILSTSSYGQQLVPRLIKEKFAAVRKAKLRLSNFKLEELTQILRGKSKQIKH